MARLYRPLTIALTALATSVAGAQDLPVGESKPEAAPVIGDVQGAKGREAMWSAPTAEDWAKPCLITWQRTWDDAVALSKETGKAILVCVNMDGEIASEHYAGVRYRQPDAAALYGPYVTVIASVYRHTPRDYDREGRRVLCPRFGSVTCGEHITIEPILYEKFLDGRRISPRHIMVELDGKETYDMFYAFDTASVFTTIREGIENREYVPPPDTRGDRSLVGRVASTDIEDRNAVEQAYASGDRTLRRRLLESAIQAKDISQIDLLRLAIFGLDVELAKLARQALAQATTESAIELIGEALRVPMESAEREALIAALSRLGEQFPRAKTLAAVHRGMADRSQAVDVDGWSQALGKAQTVAQVQDRYAIETQLATKESEIAARAEDPDARLELAEASLALAVDPVTVRNLAADTKTGRKLSRLMFEDVRRNGFQAERLGAKGWRVDAVIALADYYLGDLEQAYSRAAVAVEAMPTGEPTWNGMAVLALFAEGRREAIAKAVRAKEEWPAQWLTDVHAAYDVLAKHPLGNDSQIVAHYDFLGRLGARGQAQRVLDGGIERFPASWPLHERLRGRILFEQGVAELEATYARMLAEEDAPPTAVWFAGYASLVAAEFHRRRGEKDAATEAYGRAIGLYERAAQENPDGRDHADHYVALALAGRARMAMEREEWELAAREILASFARRDRTASSVDGLNVTPVMTATTLIARMSENGSDEIAARVQAALDALDPVLLRPPGFEFEGRDAPMTGGAPPRRRRR